MTQAEDFDLHALQTALDIRTETSGTVTAITMGIPAAEKVLRDAISRGANDGAILSDRAFAGSDTLATSYALSLGVKKLGGEDLILCGKMAVDGDIAQIGPELAQHLGIPHVSDVCEILEAAEDHLIVRREWDDVEQEVYLPLPEPAETAITEPVMVPYNDAAGLAKLLKETAITKGADISQSKIIVAAGRGIGQKKNLKLVKALADKLGGQVGASRPLIDMGFCPYSSQIGQTGYSVAPDLLICCGISGAVQHLAGIGGAKTVIAINTDPKAPIFAVADYQIVGDCVTVLEQLLQELD